MSQENVESFRRAAAAGARFDIEALLDELDPGVEWHAALPALVGGGEGVYRGHDGVRRLWNDFQEAFAESQLEFPEIKDLGERVLGIGRLRMRGQSSGVEVESPVAYLVSFRGGKVIQVHTYLDPAEALEAAGLSE